MFNHSIQAGDTFFELTSEQIADRVRDGVVATAISVRWRSEATGHETQSAEFAVQTNQETNTVQLVHKGDVLGEVNLDTELPPESADPADADEILASRFPTSAALASIVTALDPVVGCLIKGAALSVADQTIRCWRSTNQTDPFPDRARDAAACLRQNGMRVGWKFIVRLGRCLISLGLD